MALVVNGPRKRRRLLRVGIAALSMATAAIYLGIGLGVLQVVDGTAAGTPPDLFGFGASAATAFLVGTFLLLRFDRRGLWVLGAILQVSVVVVYFAVAPQRTPPFEAWGLLIKLLQVAILTGLVVLIVSQSAKSDITTRGVNP